MRGERGRPAAEERAREPRARRRGGGGGVIDVDTGGEWNTVRTEAVR